MPCSVAQKRFWLLEEISPGNTALLIPIALRLAGPLDVDLLRRALNAIVARHEILRTRFALVDGEPKQIIAPETALELARIDAGPVAPELVPEVMRREMLAETRRPLDFSRAPLLRATLVRLGPEEHLLMLTAHHIVSDGWSNGVLVREVALFYDAWRRHAESPLPPLQIQYADFAHWQENWLGTPEAKKQLDYWKETLAGEMPVLDFPADFSRLAPAAQAPDAVLESLLLPRALTDGLKELGRAEGVTLFMIFHAAYVALLRRYTGQENFLTGTTAANRNKAELEPLIGLFANILLLRSDVPPGISFRDFLARQRDVLLGAFAHHEAPFELVLEACGGGRKAALQTHFLFQRAFMHPAASDGLSFEPLHSVSPGSTFELTFGIVERTEGIRLQMEYRTGLYHGATIRRLLRHFQMLLESALAQPETAVDDLSLFGAGEKQELEARLQPSVSDATMGFDPAATIADLDRQIERHFGHPDATPFLFPVELPPGVTLIALDPRLRLLPLGVPGEVYLAHAGRRGAGSEIVSGPAGLPAPLPLLKTGFLGRNVEGGVALGGREQDIVTHRGFRVHRRALQPTTAPAPRAPGPPAMQEMLHGQLLAIWRNILQVPSLTIDDNFFECGGTSFLALRMMIEAGKLCGRTLPLSLLLTGATVAHLTRYILESERDAPAADLIPLRREGSRLPLFFLHGDWAGGGFYCRQLADNLGPDQPFYVLPPYRRNEPPAFSFEQMAAHHVTALRRQAPHGPYLLGGYCIGATVAMEVARQLIAQGETVRHLFLVDAPLWGTLRVGTIWWLIDRLGDRRGWSLEKKIDVLDRTAVSGDRWLHSSWRTKWRALLHRLRREKAPPAVSAPAQAFSDESMLGGLDYSLYFLAHRLYRFSPLSVPATFYFSHVTPDSQLGRLARASRMDPALFQVERLPGDHVTCVTRHSGILAQKMGRTLDALAAGK